MIRCLLVNALAVLLALILTTVCLGVLLDRPWLLAYALAWSIVWIAAMLVLIGDPR